MKLIKNKKGHYDFPTLAITVVGAVIAYTLARKHLLTKLSKSENTSKNEKTLRFWK